MSSHTTFNKPKNQPSAINLDSNIKELNERFGFYIQQLGWHNEAGTVRHRLETDFAYALNELKFCPNYLLPKRFDDAVAIFKTLQNRLAKKQETH